MLVGYTASRHRDCRQTCQAKSSPPVLEAAGLGGQAMRTCYAGSSHVKVCHVHIHWVHAPTVLQLPGPNMGTGR